ncbi:leucyl aminopeptidase [Nocardioides sp. GY 10127]|uniref:leucyl aminopeptidase n=1 Tax=Nocardioides sp. GY 10127 TaxID=2569762 RepID=UPI0010A890D0|nr:leucyl aminopeptidase [Nocardioides sp. GY 10127]TIC85581.1 leucyl aminopeptidase [Nocardioides sp. GY 10127]
MSAPTFLLRAASPAKSKADAVVVGLVPAPTSGRRKSGPRAVLAPGAEDVAKAYGRKLEPLLSSLGLKGQLGEATRIPTNGLLGSPQLVLVGLGADPDHTALRRAAGNAARVVTNCASVALALPADELPLLRAVVEGWQLGGYTFTQFRSTQPESDAPGQVVVLTPLARRKEAARLVEETQVVVRATEQVRDWVNTPPGHQTPPALAAAVAAAGAPLAKGRGATVSITVHEEAALHEMGCGGILGVGQGSAAGPRLVEITYTPKKPVAHLALVGKGITFDSGGLTIKPASSMKEMKSDMAGAATVVAATYAIAELGLPVQVSCFAPMAENMVSGSAMRPGDVLTTYGGRTVEISNTDAEGRLVLADALGRAVERKPDLVVDVATLTGHMVVALGDKVAGVLGDDATVGKVLESAATAGEPMWHMPIPEEMKARVTSSRIADLAQHDWVRWGGGLFAAAFLREFTGGLPWAHLDIAGPSFASGTSGHVTAGGTGFSTATLVDLARSLAG